MPVVIRCYEPRKNSVRHEQCTGFVGVFPFPVELVAIRGHSTEANPSSFVCPCRKCGRLHELRRARVPTEAA